MLNFERSRASSEHMDPNGDRYTLACERLAISWGGERGWVAAAYTHPVAIIRHGRASPIVDVVMVTRLVALLTVAIAMMIGTIRR